MKMIIVNQITGRYDVDTNAESTTPTVINAETARCFYARKENKPGCRLTFDDGGGFAISDTYEEIKAKFAEQDINLLPLTMVTDVPVQIDDRTGEALNSGDEGHTSVMLNPSFIRCFYPRKDGKIGTRLTFAKGAGFAVTDLFENVTALVA